MSHLDRMKILRLSYSLEEWEIIGLWFDSRGKPVYALQRSDFIKKKKNNV